MFEIVGLLQVVSGLQLIYSVHKIRAFYKAHDDSVDVSVLWIHAMSFACYIGANLFFYSTWLV